MGKIAQVRLTNWLLLGVSITFGTHSVQFRRNVTGVQWWWGRNGRGSRRQFDFSIDIRDPWRNSSGQTHTDTHFLGKYIQQEPAR